MEEGYVNKRVVGGGKVEFTRETHHRVDQGGLRALLGSI